MKKQFHQIDWDKSLEAEWHVLLRLAATEDLGVAGDLTTRALVPDDAVGRTAVVARQSGVVAGLRAAEATAEFFDSRLQWSSEVEDGQPVAPGDQIARLEGPAGGILTAERTLLNLLGRLSGIATLTASYVKAVEGLKTEIYDTRKTTPGWRRLEKYAVRCGGGRNHRTGLFEAILIKDNHLAFGAQPTRGNSARPTASHAYTPAQAVCQARRFVEVHVPEPLRRATIVEIEVDTLEQLEAVLPAGPDIVLLDNMGPDMLRQAVARRDAVNPAIELEASGGVNLATVRALAETGVDRISVGGLTHSAVCLDFGLDWLDK